MKRKKILIPAAVAVLALLSWGLVRRSDGATPQYRFVSVGRGDVESTVTATGTLQATETVDVGTQVSGQLAEIDADYNDHVKAGQLLARIDPTILQQEVRSADASVAKNRADLEQAKRALDRSTELHAKKVVTDAEQDQAQYTYDAAKATYEQARISLDRAKRNLEYTEIRAPIDGVVVSRSVDVGQTVAASFSAPTLFVLARDLGQMEILASVDESDIGKIHQGQDVRFTVQAYPERTFSGRVRQVRLASTSTENVVNYSAVVTVANPEGALLPGMTATVEFVVDSVQDALTVPNTALRFQPTEAMRAQVAGRFAARQGADGDSAAAAGAEARRAAWAARARAGQAGGGGARSARAGSGAGSSHAILWYVDADGKLAVAPVQTGLTDGQNTVITKAPPSVKEGLQVIAAVTSGSAAPETSANPFQSGSSGGRRPPGAF